MKSDTFIKILREIVGRRFLHTSDASMARFCKGWRSGQGKAEAAVEPGCLLEMWQIVKACVKHNRIVITQAANTGLTEGSAPSGTYDRPVVVINTLRLDAIHVLKDGHQIISHPGATLFRLEQLLKPLGREPHSVIGSTNIGATIVGGVCNNSGGALTQRGPAYTELSIYAQVGHDGTLRLHNHLGVDLGNTPEEILRRLDEGDFCETAVRDDVGRASDHGYAEKVRDVTANTPSRYNADSDRLYEASGSAGRLIVFAVRLDTYPLIKKQRVYYAGTNCPADFEKLRRRMLSENEELPICGEYMHRSLFDIAQKYSKDTLLLIHWIGTDWLPIIYKYKGKLDGILNKVPFIRKNFIDRTVQRFTEFLPEILPERLLTWRDRFEHHLLIKVSDGAAKQVEIQLTETLGASGWFLCTAAEAKKASLHRFASAGAAVRYGICHPSTVEEILSLDVALRRNDPDWFEVLTPEIEKDIELKLYYGHFFCYVFHQDYVLKKGVDQKNLKHKILDLLDKRGAEYPAEHNVGHLYGAKPSLANFYKSLDPTNSFNPGIGKTSRSGSSGISPPNDLY